MSPKNTGKRFINADGKRRSRATGLAAFGIAFFAIAFVATAGLWLRHDEITRDGRATAENLVAVLSEDLEIRISGIEETLRELASFSRYIGGPNESPQEWMTLLRTAAAGLHGFEALMVTGADGRITFSSLPIQIGESRADGEAFSKLSKDPRNDTLIADAPERSANDSKPIVPLARVIRTPNAEFEGLAIANFAPEQLRKLYRAASVGENGVVWLLKPPDSVLLREPRSDSPNDEPWPVVLDDEIKPGQAGITTGSLATNGAQYITAYRSLAGTGLTVAVTLATADILVLWWNEVYAVVTLTLFAELILLFAAIVLARATTRLSEVSPDTDRAST